MHFGVFRVFGHSCLEFPHRFARLSQGIILVGLAALLRPADLAELLGVVPPGVSHDTGSVVISVVAMTLFAVCAVELPRRPGEVR